MANKKYSNLIDQLLDKNIAFAAWFFPGEADAGLLAANPEDVVFLKQFNQLNGEKGFVFAPFRITETSPVILLKPGFLAVNIQEIDKLAITKLRPFKVENEQKKPYLFLSKEEYLNIIENTVSEIRNGALSKGYPGR